VHDRYGITLVPEPRFVSCTPVRGGLA